MDARRFDSLARSLGRASRRHALQLVVAAVGTAALAHFRSPSTTAKPRLCNGKKCKGHEECCPVDDQGTLACVDLNGKKCKDPEQCCRVLDCSGKLCAFLPACVDLRTDRFHCGGCDRECDEECCKGECCFSSSGQVCLLEGCRCADPQLTRCGASCVDLETDPFNCGACRASCCGTTCTGQEACASGHCV